MRIASKIIGIAASAALVAGFGLAASAPAQSKINVKQSGTIISFKKDLVSGLATQGVIISVKAPATWNPAKAEVRFPITQVTDDAIFHSGTLIFTKGSTVIEMVNPTILTPVGATDFVVQATTALGPNTPILTLKNLKPTSACKVDKSHKKYVKKTTTRVQANVHLTSDPAVIGALAGLLGPAFTADLGLGQGRVTLVDDVVSAKKPKC